MPKWIRLAAVALAAAFSGCATLPHAAPSGHTPIRYGQSGGSEVGNFPNASALGGSERLLGDQNATTVNITPAQIATYIGVIPPFAILNFLPSLISGDCLSNNGVSLLWTVCGGGGSMTWPSSAGIPNYSDSSWGTSYSASNTIPANFLPSTLAYLNAAQSWTALQTFSDGLDLANSEYLTFFNSSGMADAKLEEGPAGYINWYLGTTNGWILYSNSGTDLFDYNYSESGAFNFAEPLYLSNLGTGTQVSCLGQTSTGKVVASSGACGTSSGAVSSITAGSSGDLNITPTTGAAVADLASQANATVCANVSGSSRIPACNTTLPALQGALNAANVTTCTPTLAAGATNDFDPTTGGTACTLSNAAITNVGYVSAIPGSGGSTLDGILAGSDKQQIWLKDNAPVGPPNQTAPSTATTGGTVAAGTYYLVWTATFSDGETLRSNEESQTTTGSTSTITGNIAQAAPGATGYRVYLGTSAGGEDVYYIVGSSATLTYTITNTSGTSGSPPSTYNAWIKLSVDSSSESTAANLLCAAGNSVLMPQGYAYLFYTTAGDCWSIGTVTNSGPSLDMLASGTSMTPDSSFDFVSETASASGTFTINCPSTNPPPWRKQILVIVNYSGSANTYTWGTCYHASSTAALPSGGTAAGAKDFYLSFWDQVLYKMDVTATNQGF